MLIAKLRKLILYYNNTPFPVSPKGEMYFLLLLPWGKACPASAGVGKGVDSKVKHYF